VDQEWQVGPGERQLWRGDAMMLDAVNMRP